MVAPQARKLRNLRRVPCRFFLLTDYPCGIYLDCELPWGWGQDRGRVMMENECLYGQNRKLPGSGLKGQEDQGSEGIQM